ncbi:MAG: undecaprenyl-diphosphate phosphatase [Buchnera aphidicola (Meitanaphis microgallis)]
MHICTPNIYHILTTIILGIIEGITEFFPISSTSHIIIFSKIFQIKKNEIDILNTFMQCGTSLSILLYFRSTFIQLFYSLCRVKTKSACDNDLSCIYIFLGTFPIALLVLFFNKYIKSLFTPNNILLSLIFGSILLTLSEIFKKKIKYRNKNINLFRSFIIGCFQCLALWPGFSRSCSTISIGVLMGLSQYKATYFSFIISVPIFFGAIALDIVNNIQILSRCDILIFIIGFLSSFITSSLYINLLFKIISTCSFVPFIIYRLILSCIIYLFFYHS